MATHYGDSDVDMLLSEFGVPVQWGLYQVQGIRDEADITMLQGQASTFVGRRTVVQIKTGSLPGIAAQEAVKVDGVDYRVMAVAEMDDGALTRLTLAAT